ncbi:MAG: hypothetical protein A2283_23260 [Lentisphaerae bacterium RIFOXYA12_FULL_48_11]|nr:MAG: hypothetical protein A2283_23260 [Lentisphaerae bacterium RIFOXYA12_FULL_48_11]
MKPKILSVMAVLFLALSVNSFAIDRDAKFIDSIGAYGMSYKDGQLLGLQVWGETALGKINKDWALLVGVGAGTDSPDDSGDTDFIDGLAGIKYYLSDLTSLALVGSYMGYDSDSDMDITAASLIGKHRFIDASEGISPFCSASASYRAIDNGDDNDSEIVGSVGLGCEFMLTEDLSIVLEGSYVRGESLNSDGFELKDAIVAAIYLTGYWD